jgi:hypothetical protein
VVFLGDDLVGGEARALTAAEETALVDRLVNETVQVVLVFLRLATVVVVRRGRVGVLFFPLLDDHHFLFGFSDLVDHLALLEAFSPSHLHFLLADGLADDPLGGIYGHELLAPDLLKVVGGHELGVGDVGVAFLSVNRCTMSWKSLVLSRRYSLLTYEVLTASGVKPSCCLTISGCSMVSLRGR